MYMKFFSSKIKHSQMKKFLWESAAVPTVSMNFGYFLNTKFMVFYRRKYTASIKINREHSIPCSYRKAKQN